MVELQHRAIPTPALTAFAAAEALGVRVDAHRQADAQRHGDAKKTFHKGFPFVDITRAMLHR